MSVIKRKTVIWIIVTILFVAAIFISYFIITKQSEKKEITISSYDGNAMFRLNILNDNITETKVETINGVQHAIINYKEESVFIEYMKTNSCYVRTFEFTDDNSDIIKKLLFLSDQYYFIVDIISGQRYAEITSLYANVSVPNMYPIFNNSINIPFDIVDGHAFGGEIELSIDEFNSYGAMKMCENAYNSYENLKEYYSNINSELYLLNDDEKTVSIKLYSKLKLNNGQHYYDGYPISIKFTDIETVLICVDLDILLAE